MQAALDITDLTSAAPVVLTLTPHDRADLADARRADHAPLALLFHRREQRAWAAVDRRGLLLPAVARKNVEARALRLLGAGPAAAPTVRALQQFGSEGTGDAAVLLSTHEGLVDRTLGEDEGGLILDGRDVPKHGTHAVGVARQWGGATGKTDHGQAGV